MKVVYFGSSEYSVAIFEYLYENGVDIAALFTQPDKPVGRKKTLTPPVMKSFVLERGLNTPIFQPSDLKDPSIVKTISDMKPDFIVVASYGKIIPKAILDIAPPINLHASILPRFRGASPMHEMILKGDRVGGVSAMLMSEGLDEGDMLSFSFLDIKDSDDLESLSKNINILASHLALKTLKEFKSITPIEQFHPLASYCKKIKKEHGVVTFDSANSLYRKYRAYKIWPGVMLSGGLKLTEIIGVELSGSYVAGEIIGISKECISIGCKEGRVKISKVQSPGKGAINAVDFINGRRLKVGDILF